MKTRGSFSDGVATYGSIPSVFSSDPKSPKCAERNISHKTQLAELYSENIVGKILRVARESLRDNVREFTPIASVRARSLTWSSFRTPRRYILRSFLRMGHVRDNINHERSTFGLAASSPGAYTHFWNEPSSIPRASKQKIKRLTWTL